MYIIIRRRSDLSKLHHLKDKERILTRFVMNKCGWCHSSQPDWDNMTLRTKDHLDDHDALVEVESRFIDKFREFMARHRKPYPPVRSYPSVYVMNRGMASPHQGRDTESFIQTLQQLQMLRDPKPHVSFMDTTLSPVKHIKLKSPPLKTIRQSRKRSKSSPLSFTIRRHTRTPTFRKTIK